jgi:hypothetical protein
MCAALTSWFFSCLSILSDPHMTAMSPSRDMFVAVLELEAPSEAQARAWLNALHCLLNLNENPELLAHLQVFLIFEYVSLLYGIVEVIVLILWESRSNSGYHNINSNYKNNENKSSSIVITIVISSMMQLQLL